VDLPRIDWDNSPAGSFRRACGTRIEIGPLLAQDGGTTEFKGRRAGHGTRFPFQRLTRRSRLWRPFVIGGDCSGKPHQSLDRRPRDRRTPRRAAGGAAWAQDPEPHADTMTLGLSGGRRSSSGNKKSLWQAPRGQGSTGRRPTPGSGPTRSRSMPAAGAGFPLQYRPFDDNRGDFIEDARRPLLTKDRGVLREHRPAG